MHRLRDLAEPEHVFQVRHDALRLDFPPLASLDVRRDNLRPALTSFVGRSAELDELAGMAESARLITLVGPGGVGKTRLAVELGRRLLSRFPDGVWAVELAAIDDGTRVETAVASAIGVQQPRGMPLDAAIAHALAGKHMLLILDNCEHVIDAAAAMAQAALLASEDVRVVATSREPLRLRPEHIWRVPALSLGDDGLGSEAVALFVERARRIDGSFSADGGARDAVERICRRVDGMPLALELAAARLDEMPVTRIADRLEAGPGGLDVLTGTERDLETRHRSLTDTIAWSFDLLTETEREAFAAVAVFPSSFDAAAADEVIGQSSDALLNALARKSLLQRVDLRFVMLETVRAFAAQRLAESERADPAHERFVDWAVTISSRNDLELLDIESENVLAALHWATERTPERALAIAAPLGWWFQKRGNGAAGRDVLRRVLEKTPDAATSDRARVLAWAGTIALDFGDITEAKGLLDDAVAMAEAVNDPVAVDRSRNGLALAAVQSGDLATARDHLVAALAAAEQLNDQQRVSSLLSNLGVIAQTDGDLDEAERLFRRAVALASRAEPNGNALTALGGLRLIRGDVDEARSFYQQALAAAESTGDRRAYVHLAVQLPWVSIVEERRDVAAKEAAEGLAIARGAGVRRLEAYALETLAAAVRSDNPDHAAELYEGAREIWIGLGDTRRAALAALGIGLVDLAAARRDAAVAHFRASLESLSDGGTDAEVSADALDCVAALALVDGNLDAAAEFAGAAAATRAAKGTIALDRIVDMSQLDADALARGQHMSTEQAVAAALAYM